MGEVFKQLDVHEKVEAVDSFWLRRCLLKLCVGNISREEVKNWGFHTGMWQSAADENKAIGMRIQALPIRARKSISDESKLQIREHFLSDQNSVVLASKHAKTETPRALTTSKKEAYRTDPNKSKYSYSTIIKYSGTGPKAIMPDLRAAVGATDMCNKCLEGKGLVTHLKKLAGRKTCEDGPDMELVEYAHKFIDGSKHDLHTELSRSERAKLDQFVQRMSSVNRTDAGTVSSLLRRCHALGQHWHMKETIHRYYNLAKAENFGTGERIVRNLDWKENLSRGHGPVEGAHVFYNLKATACYGMILYCYHPVHRQRGQIVVACLSDCLAKSAQAAIHLSAFIMEQVFLILPWFKPIWKAAETVSDFYDKGKHFWSKEFLGEKLLVEPRQHKKLQEVQLFEGGHGKTYALDSGVFSVVSRMLDEMTLKEQVTTTQQMRVGFTRKYELKRAEWPQKKQD